MPMWEVVIKHKNGIKETKNIYLGNMNGSSSTPNLGYLNLTPGGVAIFIKIDETVTKNGVTYYETYNLISYKLKQ